MKWLWKIEPLDPATVTPEQIVAEANAIARGRLAGAVAGILAATAIYFVWDRFGYENKWVEYTMLPAIVIGGVLAYRIAYEIAIRIRP
jgi:hypothetical protein